MSKRKKQDDKDFVHHDMSVVPGVTEAPTDSAIIGLNPTITTRRDKVTLGRDIMLLGYPTSLADPVFFEKNTPLLRTGVVAGIVGDTKIVIDCPVYSGNSGGLVLRADPGQTFHGIGVASRTALNFAGRSALASKTPATQSSTQWTAFLS